MIINTIVAVGHENAIGVGNELPWHMPADLKFFKETTRGHHVIMGRKSFESIGRPLPGRTNIVITRQKDYHHSGIILVNSISDALKYVEESGVNEVFILGGSMIYHQTKDLWNNLYITHIDTAVPNATAFFPEVNFDEWELAWQESHKADEKNQFDYRFSHYKR